MGLEALTTDQRSGVKASLLVLLLILALFVAILVAGSPIMYFGAEPPSVAYAIAVYVPVIAVCIIAYQRLRRA